MTTFSKNPHAEKRKKMNYTIFSIGLKRTLKDKFKHKKFSERFAMANAAFIGIGGIAQFASLTTAFTMLSYLFVTIHVIARVVCAAALVLAIEGIKRESTNDVMKGIFQYKEVEKFPGILALITVGASIYISVEGAKILPSLFISDAVQELPVSKSPESIKKDFASRILDKETERNDYRIKRTWQGRLASKDAKVIKQYNEDIKELQVQKDESLKGLKIENRAAITKSEISYKKVVEQVEQQRAKLSEQLVYAAIGFEVLFLLSMCFSWWYYAECEKEKSTSKVIAKTPINTGSTSKVQNETLEVQEDKTLEVQEDKTLEVGGSPRSIRKIGFGNEENDQENALEIEKIKKDYTRICPQCNTPFIHKTHNHTYCKRSCMIEARNGRR